jgi:hypothetical protein
MLTSAYPAGLFGDPDVPGPWSPGYGAPQGYGFQPGYGQAGYVAQLGYGAGGELSWRLILSGAARKLMVGFLVLGVLISVGIGVTDAVVISNGGNAVVAAIAANQVETDAIPVTNAVNNYSAGVKACNGQLACVAKLDRQVAATFNTFAGQLRTIPMPSQATAANTALVSSVSRTASIFARLGAATSAAQYNNIDFSAGLNQALNQVNQAYTNLGTALGA